MSKFDLIAKHINVLTKKVEECDTICCFSGEKITSGVRLKNVISDVFTDHEYIRYNSTFVSENVAKCFESFIQGNKGLNPLRNYSYYIDGNEIKTLKREEILPFIESFNPSGQFILCVTYNSKKHTFYKSVLNNSNRKFVVTTENYNVEVDLDKIGPLLEVLKRWYTVIPGKETTAAQPTFFTKDNILYGNAEYKKQLEYGIEQYEQENEFIKPYRSTNLLQFLCFILNKS